MSAHELYVASAYGIAFVSLGGLIIVLLIDGLFKKKQLAQLEATRTSSQNRTG